MLISSATPKSAVSSRLLAPAESSVAFKESLTAEPWDRRTLIFGSEIRTVVCSGSVSRMPLGSSFAPRRKGGRRTTVVSNISRTNSVLG